MYIRLWQSWKRKTHQQSGLLKKITGKKLNNARGITCKWVAIIYYLCTFAEKILHSPYLYPAVSWWSWHPDSGILSVANFWWSLVIRVPYIVIFYKQTTYMKIMTWEFLWEAIVDVIGVIKYHHIEITNWERGSDYNPQITLIKGDYTLYCIW